MNLQEIYNYNKKEIIGSQIEYINILQKKLIQNYNLDPKIIKNNESIKHYDKGIINSIDFNLNNTQNKLKINNSSEKNNLNITISNGNSFLINDLNKKIFSFKILSEDKDFTEKMIKKYNDNFKDDYIVNLNTILLNSGFGLNIKKNSNSKIEILHQINSENITIFSKNFFSIEENSKVIIIEKFDNKIKSNANVVNYFEIGAGADVIHLVIQENMESANLQFSSHIDCHASSNYKQLIFNVSSSSTRNHHEANLIGQKSNILLHGVFFASNKQIVDNKTTISHLHPDCKSNQTYKAILTDQSKGSYLSKTYVDQKAQKTEGYQLSKGMLLSENSSFHSKPELKIYADDVKCSHGSTIGPFDEDILFYIRSRGLNLYTAKSLLIKSFYSDLLKNINEEEFEEYQEYLDRLVDIWLRKNIF